MRRRCLDGYLRMRGRCGRGRLLGRCSSRCWVVFVAGRWRVYRYSRRLREIRAHGRLAVFACAFGLARSQLAGRLRVGEVRTRITGTTRATLAAITVAGTAAMAVRAVTCAAFRGHLSIGFVLALGRGDRVAGVVQTRAPVVATAAATTAAPTFTAFAGLARRAVIAVGVGLRSRIASAIGLAFALLRALAAFTALATFAMTSTASACGTRALGTIGINTHTVGVITRSHGFALSIKTLALAAAFTAALATTSTASATAVASFATALAASFATPIGAGLATAFAACATALAVTTTLTRRAAITALFGFGCSRLHVCRR